MNQSYSHSEQVGALAMVCGFAALGGILFGLLDGYTFPKIGRFPGYSIKPLMTKVRIPPLTAMIMMGFIVRNFGGTSVEAYPIELASLVRSCVLGIGMLRAGLSLVFKGKVRLIILLTLGPHLMEATAVAVTAHGLFDMPMSVAYSLGFSIAVVAGALVVPSMIDYSLKGYGHQKKIP